MLPVGAVRHLTSAAVSASSCRCAAFEALLSYPGGLQLGGGVTDLNAASYIAAGASHVIVTSHVFNAGRLDEERLQELVTPSAPLTICHACGAVGSTHAGKVEVQAYLSL